MRISHRWNFGDDKELANTLKNLVLSGRKIATAGLYYEGKKIPITGEFAEILDSENKPFCVIQYVRVEVKPFSEVSYSFIVKEGEDDKDIEEWRQKFRKFFNLKSDDVKVVCEEFRVVSS